MKISHFSEQTLRVSKFSLIFYLIKFLREVYFDEAVEFSSCKILGQTSLAATLRKIRKPGQAPIMQESLERTWQSQSSRHRSARQRQSSRTHKSSRTPQEKLSERRTSEYLVFCSVGYIPLWLKVANFLPAWTSVSSFKNISHYFTTTFPIKKLTWKSTTRLLLSGTVDSNGKAKTGSFSNWKNTS